MMWHLSAFSTSDNEICSVLTHWLRPCSAIDGNGDMIQTAFAISQQSTKVIHKKYKQREKTCPTFPSALMRTSADTLITKFVSVYVYIYIYIYIERERERDINYIDIYTYTGMITGLTSNVKFPRLYSVVDSGSMLLYLQCMLLTT